MSCEDDGKVLWFQYLSKLNDRTLNRKIASGITTWTIAVVLAVLVFKFIDQIPLFNKEPNIIPLHTLSLSITMSVLCLIVLLIMGAFSTGTPFSEGRLSTKLEKRMGPYIYIPLLSLMFILSALNFLSLEPAKSRGLSELPFIILGIFFGIQFLGPAVMKIVFFVRRKSKDDETQDTPTLLYKFSPSHKNAVDISMIAIFFLFFIVALIPVFEAFPRIKTEIHTNAIKWSLHVGTIIFISIYLCGQIAQIFRVRYLEELERRIFLENLSSNEIRNLFVRDYLGPSIQEWLTGAELKLKRLQGNFIKEFQDAESQLNELEKIDRSMTYEIQGRADNICINLKNSWIKYKDYSSELRYKLQKFVKNLELYPDQIKSLFKDLLESWSKQLNTIDEQFDKIMCRCDEMKSGLNKIDEKQDKQETS